MNMSPWASSIVLGKKHTPEGAPQQVHLRIGYIKCNSLLPTVTPAMGTKKCAFALIPLTKFDDFLHY